VTSSGFKLQSLPPTSAATKFHSYRAYLAVQQWQGNEMPSTEWGWQYRDGLLVPIETDRPVAPDQVLKRTSCGCKAGCGKRCTVLVRSLVWSVPFCALSAMVITAKTLQSSI